MGTSERRIETVHELQRWCAEAPAGTRVDAHEVARILAQGEETDCSLPPEPPAGEAPAPEWTWRERLWLVPPETRVGTKELTEALGRPASWIYARTQSGAEDPIPHRKLDGILIFTAGEIREWIRRREEILVPGLLPASRNGVDRLEVAKG